MHKHDDDSHWNMLNYLSESKFLGFQNGIDNTSVFSRFTTWGLWSWTLTNICIIILNYREMYESKDTWYC